jgi:hypothetical protein
MAARTSGRRYRRRRRANVPTPVVQESTEDHDEIIDVVDKVTMNEFQRFGSYLATEIRVKAKTVYEHKGRMQAFVKFCRENSQPLVNMDSVVNYLRALGTDGKDLEGKVHETVMNYLY